MDPTAPNPPNNSNPPDQEPIGPVTTEPISSVSSSPPDPPMGFSQNFDDPPRPNVSATSIDPNDPLATQSAQNTPQGDNTILPGQFVESGGDTQTPQPAPQGAFETGQSQTARPWGFSPTTLPPQPVPVVSEPEPQLAAQILPQPASQSEPASTLSASQPDPTPYIPPPLTPGSQPTASAQGSIIGKLRVIAIVLGVLVLLGAIAAVAWFFFLGKSPQEAVKTEAQSGTVVEEPAPLPKRTEGGFGTLPALPQSTGSAQQSTPSATP